MRRSWLIWASFLVCLAVVLTAMAWISLAALRLDRAEAAARQQTDLEERIRLALWRADSTLAPLVAQESVRPWFAYRAFLPADRAYGNMFNDRAGGERLLPSPLLAGSLPHVLVHFQFEPDGRITSPQVPGRENFDMAVPLGVSRESVRKFQAQLGEVLALVDRKRLLEMLPESPAVPMPVVVSGPPAGPVPLAMPVVTPPSATRPAAPSVAQAGVPAVAPAGRGPAVVGLAPLDPPYAPAGPRPATTQPPPMPRQPAAQLPQQPAPQLPQQPAPQLAQQEMAVQQFQPQALLPNSPLSQTQEQRRAIKNRRADIQQNAGQSAVEYDVRQSLLGRNSNFQSENNGQQWFANPSNAASGGVTLPAVGGTVSNGSLPSAVNAPANPNGTTPAFEVSSAVSPNIGNGPLALPSTDLSGVAMTPLWIRGQLILARRVVAGGNQYVQGCLLDWLGIKAVLLETISDLLPAADFEPVEVLPADEGRMLAALPVRLLPGSLGTDGDGRLSPILLSLAVAWTCMSLAAVAVGGLLAGVMRLGRRRESFVTAVTHELRTPLTTFQMYAEMLAEGMVREGPQQRQYLATLRAEAVRLTHLVENVLSYARLERGRSDGRRESLPLGPWIERLSERLRARAEEAGMHLVIEAGEAVRAATVRANPSAAEQVLFNLLDNACKYAAGSDDPRLHLALALGRDGAEVSLRDHGPGVSASVRRRLFRPFSKSAREAAHSAPGVGLGLALSRRLARDMGGDLRLGATAGPGACFVLVLPLDRGG
jgi:signal transduction histidine kinase